MKCLLVLNARSLKRMALASMVLTLILIALESRLTFVVPVSAAAADCTLYASPTGNPNNAGTSPSSPLTLEAAANRTQPGSIVCLLAGTYAVTTPFQITRSGTSAGWVVYTSYDGGVIITPKSGTAALLQIPGNVRYIEIRGLQLDGKNSAASGIQCKGGDHIRIVGNKIQYMGASGISTYPDGSGKKCDYITVDHNTVFHSGYNQGWSSAITFNQQYWYDQYQGFHSYVTNNIVSGQFDGSGYHSDGNGIIMDNQGGSGNTPPVLIANNLVYENGGRCIHGRYGNNYWIVNNTCYKNGLDLRVRGGRMGNNGEFVLYGASGNYVINNIAYAWNNRRPYSDEAGVTATYSHNLWITSGTGTNVVPARVLNAPNQLKKGNPLFVSRLPVNRKAGGQYANAVNPASITNQFYLRAGSPAINGGIDPTTIGGISANIINDLKAYVYTDILGVTRPQGGAFDLGAYEYH